MQSDQTIRTSGGVTPVSLMSEKITTQQYKVTRDNQGTKIYFQVYQEVKILQVQVYTQASML